jgi:hypothetical protein
VLGPFVEQLLLQFNRIAMAIPGSDAAGRVVEDKANLERRLSLVFNPRRNRVAMPFMATSWRGTADKPQE